jgi:DNA adenine methylase
MQIDFTFTTKIGFTGKTAKPFMKWAGGKSQLIEKFSTLFPSEIRDGTIKKYAEPFIGGGALFFYIAQSYPSIEKFFISDANEELILAYETIKRDVDGLISLLGLLEKENNALSLPLQKDFFYQKRADFNKNQPNINFREFQATWIERTATIIFLNRTCFNGLFRVNSKGEFNVPFGDYENPRICDAENLYTVSALLQRTVIELGDFAISTEFADDHTFVYFDPPYRPISKTANFTSYSKSDFGEDSQKRLAQYFSFLSKKGAKLMLSNSDPKNENPNDHFFEDLYKDFRIERVDASRMINSNGNKRGKIKELVILNY